MDIAVLDKQTLTCEGDVDFSPIEKLGNVRWLRIGSEEDIIRGARGCTAVLCNKILITRRVLESLPEVKYVGVFATGYNNVDLKAARELGVTVTNVPGYSGAAVAQHVMALILHFYSKADVYDRAVRAGEWEAQDCFSYFPYPMHEVCGKTLGIFGFGDIGKRVAKAAAALDMKVLVHTRTLPENCPYELVGKKELFSRSDVLTLHCPLTEQTEKLINKDTLALMKSGAILINTARGGLVDEDALYDALTGGRIRAAALDVLGQEPPRANRLIGLDNCVITPHVAWAPAETRNRLVSLAAKNLTAYMCGMPINTI
ncbi:MAG TPA: D-2-hydroxyacid dehydrogenase [Firmicutes bacterium]|nr:D-2-hydroxyacid dehydrogenase [Bacillota bacterium]